MKVWGFALALFTFIGCKKPDSVDKPVQIVSIMFINASLSSPTLFPMVNKMATGQPVDFLKNSLYAAYPVNDKSNNEIGFYLGNQKTPYTTFQIESQLLDRYITVIAQGSVNSPTIRYYNDNFYGVPDESAGIRIVTPTTWDTFFTSIVMDDKKVALSTHPTAPFQVFTSGTHKLVVKDKVADTPLLSTDINLGQREFYTLVITGNKDGKIDSTVKVTMFKNQ